MSYRANLDALAARHAALARDLTAKQRELRELTALIAEARQLDEAEAWLCAPPASRRRRARRTAATAIALVLVVTGGLWAVGGSPQPATARDACAARAAEAIGRAELAAARHEALRAAGALPATARATERRAHDQHLTLPQYLLRQELARAGFLDSSAPR
jgi:hypothetical protein